MLVECDGLMIEKQVKTDNCSALVLKTECLSAEVPVSDSTAPNSFVLKHFPRFSRSWDQYSDL